MFDIDQIIKGATGGAAAGSAIPFLGSAMGGILGGLGGLFGGKKRYKQQTTLTGNQQQANKDQFGSFYNQGPFADLYNYNPEMANTVFDQTRFNPAMRNWNEGIVPKITGQFRGDNMMQSSYAGDALARSGRDLTETLEGQRNQYLYGLESEARSAKRKALEDYQNRSMFKYDTNPQQNTASQVVDALSDPEKRQQLLGMLPSSWVK